MASDTLSKILDEIQDLRQARIPKRSIPFILAPGTQTIASQSYVDLLQWRPQKPGGVLIQILLEAATNFNYRIIIDNNTVGDEINWPSGLSDLTLRFGRTLVRDTKNGVRVQVRRNTTSISSGLIFGLIQGEQVIEW